MLGKNCGFKLNADVLYYYLVNSLVSKFSFNELLTPLGKHTAQFVKAVLLSSRTGAISQKPQESCTFHLVSLFLQKQQVVSSCKGSTQPPFKGPQYT